MFGVPRYQTRSDRPLDLALSFFDALARGRSASDKHSIGSSLIPWAPILDAQIYKERPEGPSRAAHAHLALGPALAKHGDIDLFSGLLSRSDFFSEPPFFELRDSMLHNGRALPIACACEAISLGRLDLLDALLARARAEPADPEAPHGFISCFPLQERSAHDLLFHLATARALSLEARSVAFCWVRDQCPSALGARLADDWLDIAATSRSENSIRSAIALGALPQRRHAIEAASFGAFALASELAPVALPDKPSRAPGFTSSSNAAPDAAVRQMARSYEQALPSISEGFLTPADPGQGREATWAQHCDYREHNHQGALLALRGAFDTPFDNPLELLECKALLASSARAMASLGAPRDAERLQEIALAFPKAPPSSSELLFLSQTGSDRLDEALSQASPAQGSIFCHNLAKAHAAAFYDHARAVNHKWSPQATQAKAASATMLTDALYRSSQRSSALFDPAARDALGAHIRLYGLDVEFERRAIEESTPPATRKRSALKV